MGANTIESVNEALNQTLNQPLNQSFADDVITGLSSRPKSLQSKYFYDDRGSQLFQAIMAMDSYYLTDCELEILETHCNTYLDLFADNNLPFDLVELGAGDGMKTKVLLRHFLDRDATFRYTPIDISSEAMRYLVGDLNREMPSLNIAPKVDDYFHALHVLQEDTSRRRVVLFLGSSIGNFTNEEAISFLKHIAENLNPGDLFVIGFDLMKAPQQILQAYDDPQGITREFNLNLLDRMNRELGGNFDRKHFLHAPTYNPATGETKSYLVSTMDQTVTLERIGQSFSFDAWEAIDMEISKKYSLREIDDIAASAGFTPLQSFFDRRRWFVNAVWRR